MSRLAELIEELCPDGVEYKPIGSFAQCVAGATPNSKDPSLWDGDIPWMSSGEVNKRIIYSTDRCLTQRGFDSCSTKMVPAGAVVVALAGQGKTRGTVARTRIELCTNQSLCAIISDVSVDSDFLFHYLVSQYNNLRTVSSGDGTRGGLNLKMIREYRVPVPPLEVQREIVGILDQFTTLEAELEAELEARRAQYEHYRNHLLSYDSLATCGPVDMVELGSVVTLLDSRRIPLKKGDRVSGEYPYYGASGIVDYVDSYIFDEDLLLVSEDGANLKARTKPIAFSTSGRVWVNNHAHVLKVESSFYQKFLEEYLNSLDLEPYLVGSTQPKLNQSGLLSIPVPLPTEQALERSVLLLEKLKLFVTDFSAGLPAEIAARRAQYEHYRDRLLSFPEKRVSDRESS